MVLDLSRNTTCTSPLKMLLIVDLSWLCWAMFSLYPICLGIVCFNKCFLYIYWDSHELLFIRMLYHIYWLNMISASLSILYSLFIMKYHLCFPVICPIWSRGMRVLINWYFVEDFCFNVHQICLKFSFLLFLFLDLELRWRMPH